MTERSELNTSHQPPTTSHGAEGASSRVLRHVHQDS